MGVGSCGVGELLVYNIYMEYSVKLKGGPRCHWQRGVYTAPSPSTNAQSNRFKVYCIMLGALTKLPFISPDLPLNQTGWHIKHQTIYIL